MAPTKVAILGAGFIADIHLESYTRFVPDAQVTAVFSRSAARAEAFATHWKIPRWFSDLDTLIRDADCDVIDICLPNFLHHRATLAAARSGRHVIIEKPLCMTLEEADEMIAVCRQHGRKLMYAEELCFAPKYERVRALVKEGAVGDIYMLKQLEKHSGPHSDWFWDVEQSGGGVLMDMGCHGIAFCNWFLNRPKLERITAQGGTYVHRDKTRGDDNCIVILEFAGGKVGLVEDSWARTGGMDDRIEVFGSKGCTYGNLHMGNALPTFSEVGFGYAVEKAPTTIGWTYPVFEELWNYGFPQEMTHFAQCVRGKVSPIATGEDGRFVQQVLFAAYQSMGAGQRVDMPFDAYGVKKPIDLWFNPKR